MIFDFVVVLTLLVEGKKFVEKRLIWDFKLKFVSAEVNHFQHYRVGDFAGYIKEFLEQQMAFHQEVRLA